MSWIESLYNAMTYDSSNLGLIWGGDCVDGSGMPYYAANHVVAAISTASHGQATEYLNCFMGAMCHHENIDLDAFQNVIHKTKSRVKSIDARAAHVYMKECGSNLFSITSDEFSTVVLRSNRKFQRDSQGRMLKLKFDIVIEPSCERTTPNRATFSVREGDVVIIAPSALLNYLGMDNLQTLVSDAAMQAFNEHVTIDSSDLSVIFKNYNAMCISEIVSASILNPPKSMMTEFDIPSCLKEVYGRSVLTGIVVKSNNVFFPTKCIAGENSKVLNSYGACDQRQFACNYPVSLIERTLFSFCVNSLESCLLEMPRSSSAIRSKMEGKVYADEQLVAEGKYSKLIYRYEKHTNPQAMENAANSAKIDEKKAENGLKKNEKDTKTKISNSTTSIPNSNVDKAPQKSIPFSPRNTLQVTGDDDKLSPDMKNLLALEQNEELGGCLNSFRFFSGQKQKMEQQKDANSYYYSPLNRNRFSGNSTSSANSANSGGILAGCFMAAEPLIPHSPSMSVSGAYSNNIYYNDNNNVNYSKARCISMPYSDQISPSALKSPKTMMGSSNDFSGASPTLMKALISPPTSPGIMTSLRNITSSTSPQNSLTSTTLTQRPSTMAINNLSTLNNSTINNITSQNSIPFQPTAAFVTQAYNDSSIAKTNQGAPASSIPTAEKKLTFVTAQQQNSIESSTFQGPKLNQVVASNNTLNISSASTTTGMSTSHRTIASPISTPIPISSASAKQQQHHVSNISTNPPYNTNMYSQNVLSGNYMMFPAAPGTAQGQFIPIMTPQVNSSHPTLMISQQQQQQQQQKAFCAQAPPVQQHLTYQQMSGNIGVQQRLSYNSGTLRLPFVSYTSSNFGAAHFISH